MSAQPWLDRAEQLRSELARLRAARPADAGEVDSDEQEAMERLTIARRLRAEFSNEAPDDTATLSLFPEEAVFRNSDGAAARSPVSAARV